jgi:glycosyltransferase involved in cell wall biosynthesis
LPLLSIIIPVFNVEQYLGQCLDSILHQNFNDYEVILIDNGSTDASGEICDAYASNHDFIHVIHLKVNSLPAGARNVGLGFAVGEYVHFCDSDDFYVEGSFERIARLLNDRSISVLFGQFIAVPEKGAFICNDVPLDPQVFAHCDASVISEYLLTLPNLLCTPWRLIVKRTLLLSERIAFPEGYHSEDEEWFPKVICSADTFALLSEPFYFYRPRALGSVSSVKTFLNSKSHIAVAINLLRFLNDKKFIDPRRDLIQDRVNLLYALFSTQCDTFTREQLHELADLLEDNLDLHPMIREISPSIDLFEFAGRYGSYKGLCLYRTLVMEETLEQVYGKENKDIYIFPTGYNGEGTARILQNAGYNVRGFIDNSELKNGSIINGLLVSQPNILKNISPDKRNQLFVIVTSQWKHVVKSIINQLREMGLSESQFCSRVY